MQFVVFEKFTIIYWHQIARKIMWLLFNTVHGKKNAESQERRNFESVRALLVICTRVTTSQSCYTRMQSFSANQCVIFLRIINSIKRRGVSNSVPLKHINRVWRWKSIAPPQNQWSKQTVFKNFFSVKNWFKIYEYRNRPKRQRMLGS